MKITDERLDELLTKGSFANLSEDDKRFVVEHMLPEAFDQLRKTDLLLKENYSKSRLLPDMNILANLQTAFAEKHSMPAKQHGFFTFRIPAYAAAALVILSVGITMLISPRNGREREMAATVKTDTVFITKFDTIVVERTVYMKAPATQTFAGIIRQNEKPATEPEFVSASMKDKEDLNKLLVSETN